MAWFRTKCCQYTYKKSHHTYCDSISKMQHDTTKRDRINKRTSQGNSVSCWFSLPILTNNIFVNFAVRFGTHGFGIFV